MTTTFAARTVSTPARSGPASSAPRWQRVLSKLHAWGRWRDLPLAAGLVLACAAPAVVAQAQNPGFSKINDTVNNVNAILVTISIAVVTIAIIWAGFKMIFQGARLTDVANVLIGGTLVGGAAAFASFIVT